MRTLIAGEGGSVLVAGSVSPHAAALAIEGLGALTQTPSGLPVHPVDHLPDVIVDAVELTACEESTRLLVQAWADERGIPIRDAHIEPVPAPDGVRVVAVSAVSTGSGKTSLVRRVARGLQRSGSSVAIARHPIANLMLWDRFAASIVRSPPELGSNRPIEEREELAPLVGLGIPCAVGCDPDGILNVAAREAGDGGVVVWDGGGAAAPWVRPDIHLLAICLLRPLPSSIGERLATTDAVVLTKADTAEEGRTRAIEERIRELRPDVPIVLADLAVGVQDGRALQDKRVVIVEDWPSLVLGGMSAGAGAVAAQRFRCGVVDPRPFAIGAVRDVLATHAHIGAVIPSIGRTQSEIEDFAASVRATPGDVILWASNADPAGVIGDETRPVIRAFGELTEVAGASISDVLSHLL